MNVEIRIIDTQKGRGLFATQDIPNGTVIFEEDPLVSCQFAWNKAYGYQACDHCLRPLETAQENARRLTAKPELVLPYPQCCITNKNTIVSCAACGEKYCSEACRVIALNQYHRIVCLQTLERNMSHPMEKLVQAWKECHYPPETSNIMLLVRIIAIVQQSEDRESALKKFMNFCHRTVDEDADLAHKLVGEQFTGQIDLLFNILRQCVTADGVEYWLDPDGFRSLLALIGTNGQGVATSAISTWVKNSSELPLNATEKQSLDRFIDQLYDDLEKESGTFLDNEASALYALQSSCNHSCVPNARAHFVHNNYRLSMIALKDISCGEEILLSYLDECNLNRSRHSRQEILMSNYLFKCVCEKCIAQADDPDVTSEEEMSESD